MQELLNKYYELYKKICKYNEHINSFSLYYDPVTRMLTYNGTLSYTPENHLIKLIDEMEKIIKEIERDERNAL